MSASQLRSDRVSPCDDISLDCHLNHYHEVAQVARPSSPPLAHTFSDITLCSLPPSNPIKSISSNIKYHDSSAAGPSDSPHRSIALEADTRLREKLEEINPDRLTEILNSKTSDTLIIDLRSSVQFQKSRIQNAINIAIPPLLLKRPMYTVERMAQNCEASAKAKLLEWATASCIVIHDSDSYNVGSGTTLHQIATKFVVAPYRVQVLLLKGGFSAVLRDAHDLVDMKRLEIPRLTDTGSQIPADSSIKTLGELVCGNSVHEGPINPFYNNIRQNQDLIGGVGDPIPLQIPPLFYKYQSKLPIWLLELAAGSDGPRKIAEKFLKIEQEEQQRMQRVLAAGASGSDKAVNERHSVAAAVERGDKNRYNNIWPFENARVKLTTSENNQCGYINASYLHVEDSKRYYIATQGPLPSTTKDFWQMIWENQVRTIVMLTRTVEGGQNKCHTYWVVDNLESISPYKLQVLEDNEVKVALSKSSEISFFVKKIRISLETNGQTQSRLITHVQFEDWPDFHIIQPQAILALLEQVQKAESNTVLHATKRLKSSSTHTEPQAMEPVLSHCSAGCGRTGVFCTVDTVVELVRQQLQEQLQRGNSASYACATDLVEETVRAFRDQRISMVQT